MSLSKLFLEGKWCGFYLVTLALLYWCSLSQAAIVTWQAPQYITGDTNVATSGTYVSSIVAAAAAFAPTSITVNGVTFLNDAAYSQRGFWGVGYTGFSGSNPAGLFANYNSLMNGAAPSSGTSATLTLNALLPGATYLVQFWVADYRSSITPRSETINRSGSLAFADASNTNKFSHGSFVIGTFTADTTSQTFTFNAVTVVQFNAMQLRLLSAPGQTAVINWTNVFQRIDGFGAACSSMIGIAEPQADLLFSTNIGAGLSHVRTGPHGTNSYAGEITVCQAAQSRGARIWASAYVPPMEYITDNGIVTNYFVSSATNYQNYAAFLAGFAANFKANGINLSALSIQNEPDNTGGCLWTGGQLHDFIPYLSSALTASNCASTLIMLPEQEGWGFNLATTSMNDAVTSNLVGVLAAHNYGNPPNTEPVFDFGSPCPKPVWMSEHYVAGDDSITNGLAVVQELNFFLTVVNASSYGYLWLDNSIIRGAGTLANNPGKPAKRLFATGNYSRFVRPGYYRIGVALNSSMLLSAFKDPASLNFVIVAANPTASAVNQSFTLTNFPVSGPLRAWATSDTQSLANQGGAITLTNGSFSYLLPAYSVVSFVYQPFQTNPPAILQQPVSQASVAGGTVSFSVQAAGGTAPLQYQWWFNGTNLIANATNAAVAVIGVGTTNVGSYSVVVSNALGSVTSSPATLTLIPQSYFVMTGEDGYADASFSRIGFWVDSTNGTPATSPPTNGFTYSSIYTVRTPFSAGTFVFGGDSLNLVNGGGNLLYKGYGAADTVSGNFILSGGYIANGQGNSPTITGTIQVASPSAIAPTFGRLLKIASTLNGNATLENGRGAPGTIVYSGNNVGFTGPMLVDGGAVVQVSAQTNLGGNPVAFNPGQLTLDNGTLQPKASFTLNNPNSGVTLGTGGGTFNVSNIVLTVSNPITGPGNLICAGSGTLMLAGTNTYSGNTTISNGTLLVNGSLTNSAVIVAGGTLGGTGLIRGAVTVQTGAMLAPGLAIGKLTISNSLTLASGSRTLMELNASLGTNDCVNGLTTVNFGGTLVVSNLAGTVTNRQTFKLFGAAGYTGNFSSLSNATPQTGLMWYFNPANGMLTAVPTAFLNPTNLSVRLNGTNLMLSWPADHTGWTLLSQTNNLNKGVSMNTNDWLRLTNSADTNQINIPLNPASLGGYYRLAYP